MKAQGTISLTVIVMTGLLMLVLAIGLRNAVFFRELAFKKSVADIRFSLAEALQWYSIAQAKAVDWSHYPDEYSLTISLPDWPPIKGPYGGIMMITKKNPQGLLVESHLIEKGNQLEGVSCALIHTSESGYRVTDWCLKREPLKTL
jgi:hypothetical protein